MKKLKINNMFGKRLFLNRVFYKKGPPIHLIWFVTSKCNLRCQHCFYHEEILQDRDEFSFDEIERSVQKMRPMLSVSLTGGEPFLRKDYYEIVKLLSVKKLTNNILLFTNGYNSELTLKTTEKVVANCDNVDIFIGVSIDGYEGDHDKCRNMKGSYKKAIETIKGLLEIKKHSKFFNVGALITLHKGNQEIVTEFREYIHNYLGIEPGITLIRGNAKNDELMNVDHRIYRKIINDIDEDRRYFSKNNLYMRIVNAREVVGHNLAYKTYITESRSYECYAGSLMGIIYENGDVYPCEMLKEMKMGNLRDNEYDINRIWNLEKAETIRKWIKKRKCFCTYECQYTCNTLYNVRFLPYYIKTISINAWNFKRCSENGKGTFREFSSD